MPPIAARRPPTANGQQSSRHKEILHMQIVIADRRPPIAERRVEEVGGSGGSPYMIMLDIVIVIAAAAMTMTIVIENGRYQFSFERAHAPIPQFVMTSTN